MNTLAPTNQTRAPKHHSPPSQSQCSADPLDSDNNTSARPSAATDPHIPPSHSRLHASTCPKSAPAATHGHVPTLGLLSRAHLAPYHQTTMAMTHHRHEAHRIKQRSESGATKPKNHPPRVPQTETDGGRATHDSRAVAVQQRIGQSTHQGAQQTVGATY
jgi:hypothetical protein